MQHVYTMAQIAQYNTVYQSAPRSLGREVGDQTSLSQSVSPAAPKHKLTHTNIRYARSPLARHREECGARRRRVALFSSKGSASVDLMCFWEFYSWVILTTQQSLFNTPISETFWERGLWNTPLRLMTPDYPNGKHWLNTSLVKVAGVGKQTKLIDLYSIYNILNRIE